MEARLEGGKAGFLVVQGVQNHALQEEIHAVGNRPERREFFRGRFLENALQVVEELARRGDVDFLSFQEQEIRGHFVDLACKLVFFHVSYHSDDFAGDGGQGHDPVRCAGFDGFLRHAEDNAGLLVLGDGLRPAFFISRSPSAPSLPIPVR